MADRYLAKRCECSNVYEPSVPAEEFQMNLRVLQRVAKQHSLLNLEHIVGEIFSSYDGKM